MKKSQALTQRRNLKTAEQGRGPVVPRKVKTKNYVVAFSRTNQRGGR